MTNTEAQKVLGNMLMRHDLTDAELEAIVMAGEALDDDWISVDKMLPPITDEEDRISDKVLIVGIIGDMNDARYDYRYREWVDIEGHLFFRDVTHWKRLPKGPEKEEDDDG